MKYSTGKDANVEHSTGTHYDDVKKKKKKKYNPVKHSTGSETAIKHVTGIEFERKAFEDEGRED
ncbi:hypothetical protein KJ656_05600 [bacterium]|nr:hypothetical protein [bacterium]